MHKNITSQPWCKITNCMERNGRFITVLKNMRVMNNHQFFLATTSCSTTSYSTTIAVLLAIPMLLSQNNKCDF